MQMCGLPTHILILLSDVYLINQSFLRNWHLLQDEIWEDGIRDYFFLYIIIDIGYF